jgi:phosphocarrier protein HPr
MESHDKNVVEGYFVVQNDKGMHTRPCTELVKCAGTFESEIFIRFQNNTVNAKSILELLMLAAGKGSKLHIHAQGIDAEKAVKSIINLAEDNFYLKY